MDEPISVPGSACEARGCVVTSPLYRADTRRGDRLRVCLTHLNAIRDAGELIERPPLVPLIVSPPVPKEPPMKSPCLWPGCENTSSYQLCGRDRARMKALNLINGWAVASYDARCNIAADAAKMWAARSTSAPAAPVAPRVVVAANGDRPALLADTTCPSCARVIESIRGEAPVAIVHEGVWVCSDCYDDGKWPPKVPAPAPIADINHAVGERGVPGNSLPPEPTFPREMTFLCRGCGMSATITQPTGTEAPSGWEHRGDGPPVCPACVTEIDLRARVTELEARDRPRLTEIGIASDRADRAEARVVELERRVASVIDGTSDELAEIREALGLSADIDGSEVIAEIERMHETIRRLAQKPTQVAPSPTPQGTITIRVECGVADVDYDAPVPADVQRERIVFGALVDSIEADLLYLVGSETLGARRAGVLRALRALGGLDVTP